ncbi:MAG: recombination regulator RecX, partial [Treponema sp.]|nr:recombination regulator RecX [Treponema sp.]
MTVISIKTGTDGELKRIELSDGSLFSFRNCYLAGFSGGPADRAAPEGWVDRLAGGDEISAGEEEAFRFAAICLRAERAALRLTARAEQTSRGLFRKLARRGFDDPCISTVLRRLGELGILNDRRFAGLWLRSRLARRAESPRKLLAGLRSRGIDREDAEGALKSLLDFQYESALLRGYIEQNHRAPLPDNSAADRAGAPP